MQQTWDENLYEIWVQNPDTEFVTTATFRSYYFVIINYHLKVVHPGRISSSRLTFERQSQSFCILCCITNFTIAPCNIPVFNYEFERLKVFRGFHVVRQMFQTLGSKTLKLSKVTWEVKLFARCSYFLLVAHLFLLVARYFLLVARYLLLIACHFLHVARYFLLVARYLLLVARYFLLVTCYFLLAAWQEILKDFFK